MSRPCTCDRQRPGQPYDPARDCLACWLWANNAAYREHHEGKTLPVPHAPPPRPIAEWPLRFRLVAAVRSAEDKGVGDTIARHLARFGADALKRFYKAAFGKDCGCDQRQLFLNLRFPYPR